MIQIALLMEERERIVLEVGFCFKRVPSMSMTETRKSLEIYDHMYSKEIVESRISCNSYQKSMSIFFL